MRINYGKLSDWGLTLSDVCKQAVKAGYELNEGRELPGQITFYKKGTQRAIVIGLLNGSISGW